MKRPAVKSAIIISLFLAGLAVIAADACEQLHNLGQFALVDHSRLAVLLVHHSSIACISQPSLSVLTRGQRSRLPMSGSS